MRKVIIVLSLHFVRFFVMARAENGEQTVCDQLRNSTHLFGCKAINTCPAAKEILKFGKAVACGFEYSIQKICCPERLQRTPVPLSSKVSTATTTKPPPTTPYKIPLHASSRKDPYQIARSKCVEYARARYVNTTNQLLINQPAKTVLKIECVKAEILIVGGAVTTAKEFPHMALIGYNSRLDEVSWDCAGTLISDQYVLSAAHCNTGGRGEATWVRLGERVLDSQIDGKNHKDYAIKERIMHPKYRPPQIYNDIVLFKLSSRIVFNPYIRPICLHTSDDLPRSAHNRGVITGWGFTASGEQRSEALLKATVNFLDENECVSSYSNNAEKLRNGYDARSMVCAGDKISGKDTCQGDSGGPIQIPVVDFQCMWTQVGITSYGSAFCGSKSPSIYTEIRFFIPWIQSIVWP